MYPSGISIFELIFELNTLLSYKSSSASVSLYLLKKSFLTNDVMLDIINGTLNWFIVVFLSILFIYIKQSLRF